MTNLLRTVDTLSNTITMYKGILYSLLGLVGAAEVMAILDIIGVDPFGLAISVLVLSVSCFTSNAVFARVFDAATNSESWLITALIMVCILNPKPTFSFALLAALAGVIAMASKYVLTWRHSHILNPAAVGVTIVSVTGLLSASWWIATPALLPITALIALIALRKQRRYTMFLVFAVASAATLIVVSMDGGQTVPELLRSLLLSWPLVFLGGVMLTEPVTLPSEKQYQYTVAAVVGVIFTSQLHIGFLASSPHVALLIGNVVAFLLARPFGAWLTLKHVDASVPDTLELVFEKPRRMHFKAGQYMEWTLPHASPDIRGNRRTFSIASAPSEQEIRLAVRTFEKGSSYKAALAKLQPGDRIRVANISGEFTLPLRKQKLLLIAGGIGITPFRSMIAQLMSKSKQYDVVLLYLTSSRNHVMYKHLFARAKSMGLITHCSTDQLTITDIEALVPDYAERRVYISGPNGMVTHYSDVLRSAGVPRKRIKTDYFNGY